MNYKTWFAGDSRVETYMHPISEAISRHISKGDSWTDIYNRSYEAVFKAIKDQELNVLANKNNHAIDRALAAEKERDELRERVEKLEKELVAHKCPDCAVTDFEYCPEHHSARTEIWSGGDGW
ncbi:hypothetical protein [Paenibacillus sp. NEAU-GSW1]|uniref:hypothetical protein n=1 Tax=Paenibacillus sp. NEAU-GSW1 TaxID=2682486 RepID=UPI0012E11633|nr:hypothetical protein [Paenibacillus sp. NEAU-GSW1]MUT66042.1 hypothetical protein [Paenibacillus sp. NEAU-GSW1]